MSAPKFPQSLLVLDLVSSLFVDALVAVGVFLGFLSSGTVELCFLFLFSTFVCARKAPEVAVGTPPGFGAFPPATCRALEKRLNTKENLEKLKQAYGKLWNLLVFLVFSFVFSYLFFVS